MSRRERESEKPPSLLMQSPQVKNIKIQTGDLEAGHKGIESSKTHPPLWPQTSATARGRGVAARSLPALSQAPTPGSGAMSSQLRSGSHQPPFLVGASPINRLK